MRAREGAGEREVMVEVGNADVLLWGERRGERRKHRPEIQATMKARLTSALI